MKQVPPEKIEKIITSHGEVFPDNPNKMFREGLFVDIYFANAEYLNPVTHFPDAITAGTSAAEEARIALV